MQSPSDQASQDRQGGLNKGVGFEDSDPGLWGQDAETPVRPLTREEAQALLAKHPQLSVWRVLLIQALFGVAVALVWGALSQRSSAVWSSLYAVVVVVLPGLFMARGVFGRNAGRSVGGLLFWEIFKLALACALLALAPVLVKPLDWVALLVTLVLCLKVIGVVLLVWQGRNKNFV